MSDTGQHAWHHVSIATVAVLDMRCFRRAQCTYMPCIQGCLAAFFAKGGGDMGVPC